MSPTSNARGQRRDHDEGEVVVPILRVVSGGMQVSMNVLLIDADQTGFPNSALPRLSAWHKQSGDKTYLNNGCQNPDKVYISCVFTKNASYARGIAKMFKCPVELGGYGINGVNLPNEVAHIMPDYDLCEFTRENKVGIGRTSWGCPRTPQNCPWCIIPKMEGPIRDYAPIIEFLPDDFDKLIEMSNNFIASPKCIENLQFIIDRGLEVNFSQGIDVRLVNGKRAAMLAETNFKTWRFNKRRLHIAWDRIEDEAKVKAGISEFFKAGIKGFEVMCYMLCAYGVLPEDYTYDYFLRNDMYRFEVLREFGVDPYVMIYNDRKDIPILRHFDRWVNRRIYTSCAWEDYDQGNSQEIIQGAMQ